MITLSFEACWQVEPILKVLAMAFLSKVGNIPKQTVFVGGLSYGTDGTSLQEASSQYGQVIEVMYKSQLSED
ncbi:hypothetical protein Nepgr_023758 [Nepenthes gracilis]|uniref:Uncharacterized protein n=1 Tax=Nepenthes gracilis TaxID=150966 RepID=A0AAD3XZE5_NEPGR|nr:hypothetical protein Nepgr_023758 [Nepenthes gracilis]